MSRDISGTDFEQVTFGRTLFGYDPEEVRAFVAEAGNCIAELTKPAHGDLSEAQAAEDSNLSQAKEEAMALRKAAWEAALAMLESAGAEVVAIRNRAEQEALEIIDEAERRAERNRVAARRDSKNTLANARAEHDRLVDMAKRLSQEIMAGNGAAGRPVGEEGVPAIDGTPRYPGASFPSNAQSEVDETGTIRVIHPVKAEEAEQMEAPLSAPAQENGGAHSSIPYDLDWADGSRTIRLVEKIPSRSKNEVDGVEMAREVAFLKAVQAEQERKEPDAEPKADPGHLPPNPAELRNGYRSRPRGTGPVVTTQENRENGQAIKEDSSAHDELTPLFTRLRELPPR